jgi:hypothetical protein
MLQLLSALDFERYTPRTYILSEGDHMSASKANVLELSKSTVKPCFQLIHTFLIILTGGPTCEHADNNPPTCSKCSSITLHHSIQRFKVFRTLSDRGFGQASASGRTAGGFAPSKWTGDLCDDCGSYLSCSRTSAFSPLPGAR